jgi:hypothetical protein
VAPILEPLFMSLQARENRGKRRPMQPSKQRQAATGLHSR